MFKDTKDSLTTIVKKASNVIIMGHKDLDLDALGGCVGMFYSLNAKNKYILIDDTVFELAVSKALKKIPENVCIINGNKAKELIDDDTVLVVVDTNKTYLVQNAEILSLVKTIVVVDHHKITHDVINAKLLINDTSASSSCEMIALSLKENNIKINSYIATLLLSGIVLDTNNFVLSTTVKTFEAAYFLAEAGANQNEVQLLLKQDINDYIARHEVISSVKVINKIAIAHGANNIFYRREDLAKIADTIIMFNDIEAVFVIGNMKNNLVGVSTRSLGTIDVGEIMEEMGGGGDKNEAAAKLRKTSVEEVEEKILNFIK